MSSSVVTIRDIAADTGLSVTTVSLVLSGKADTRGIAHATRRRVQDAARRMGYRGNSHARALRTGRSNVIGVLGVNLENPIPLLAVRQAARAVLERGYGIALHDLAWQPGAPESLLDHIDPRRVAGVLLLTPRRFVPAAAQLARAARHGLPIVALDDCEVPEVDVVTVDREQGAYLATRHLLELGHRQIVMTVDPAATALPLRSRVRGYRRAHAEAGICLDDSLLLPSGARFPSYGDAPALVPQVLAHPAHPTALFCVNDRLAIGALRVLYEARRRVPEDLSLVGFDGMEEAEHAMVPLTTVAQPVDEAAAAAVSLLLDRLRHGRGAPERIVIPPRLIVRRSTAPPGRVMSDVYS